MAKIKRFIRRWWWVFLLVAGFILSIVWKLLGPRKGPEPEGTAKPPTFVDRARDEVERVHLEAEVEKAKVRAQADAQKEVIAKIEEKGKTDPKGARKDIADWLAGNLR
jgi:hypothetical protein